MIHQVPRVLTVTPVFLEALVAPDILVHVGRQGNVGRQDFEVRRVAEQAHQDHLGLRATQVCI